MKTRPFLAAAIAMLFSGCAAHNPTIPPVASVDLPRFMGDWYVIAHIPSRQEQDAYDATESYRLDSNGRIRTIFRYHKGSFSAPLQTMEPVGTVVTGTNNAVWQMQFIWPIKAEYVIVDLSPDYSRTIIGRSKRDYVWLMARTPSLEPLELEAAIARIGALGYDTTQVRMVPQSARAP